MSYEATQAEYAEAFGIELPEDTGTQTESTGAAEETTAQEQTEGTEVQEGTGTEAAPEGAENGDKGKEEAMPMEERANWAERRRQWEAREKQAMEQAVQARVDQVYANMFKGQINPFTGKPIQSEADYKAYEAEKVRKEQEEQLTREGIDPKMIQSMVDQQMAPMRMQMERERLNTIQERAKTANARFEEALGKELQKITALDPAIKTLDDIKAMPTAGRFNELVQRGLGLEDAFYLANRKAIEERKMAAVKASAQTQMAGKGHLNPVGPATGKQVVQVPKGVVDAYRTMMPEATDAEIQKAYENAMKSMK
jgi:hypothetical protein